jgi:DNA invertase Pin-like site-specific DNA recombinase
MTDPARSPVASAKLRPWHLDRTALVYVRQSTPQQVADHQESTARQYALADRAVALGWPRSQVGVIDDDLGKSGQSIEGRPGFQRLLAEVALDRVGLVLGLEMSRLARSCKDWHQLLELCARFRVLLADADGVYDPTEYADRLMLGLAGMMSEAELHVLKSRMHQGKLNKARRGELIVAVPAGYLKHPSGEVTLDPDEQAQAVVRLIFDQFDAQGTVHGVLRYLIAHDVRLPVRSQTGPVRGQLEWRPPSRETIRQILRHPIYAGAYRYGHRPTDARRQRPGHPKSGRSSGLAAEDCQVFLKDRFPAYISWERFEANQLRLAANRSCHEAAGAVRDGAALLAGLVWCGRCGRRMYVRYGRRGQRPSYVCSTQRSDYGLPLCQSVAAASIEAWVAEQVLAALRPAALEASMTAAAEVEERRRQLSRHWEQRLERARFEADRAARQYHACEPENRLVARTLERRWDEALQEVRRLEADYDRFTRSQPRLLEDADRVQIRRLAEEVPALWHAPTTTAADRRHIARLLIERVVLTVDPADDHAAVRLQWAGGVAQEHRARRAVRGYDSQPDWPRLSARLATLHGEGRTPAAIAAALNGEVFRPPKLADRFTAAMVLRLLDKLGLRPRVPRRTPSPSVLQAGEWWLHELAGHLGLSPHTLQGWRRKGWLHARQVCGRGSPWAVWADDSELGRLRQLKTCPRLWTNRERLTALRVPPPRK